MIKHKRLSALVIMLVVVAGILATTGVALAGWVWCDDPIVDIGGTRVYIKYEANIEGATETTDLSDYFDPRLVVSVPKRTSFSVVLPDDWKITSKTNNGLRVTSQGIETNFRIFVATKPGAPDGVSGDTPVKVSVSLDPAGTQIVGTGEVGETINLRLIVGKSGIAVRDHDEDYD